MKKISFLPTKFKYNNYSKNIIMYYRDGKTTRLNKTEIPFDYYIYISPSYRTYGNTDSEEYRLLTTNEKLIKIYINPRDAYDLYNGRLTTGEADVSPEQRFICDSFADVDFPNDIKPRIFLLDIETHVLDGKFPSFQNNTSDITAITIYDTYTNQFYSWILPPENWDKSFTETEKLIKEAANEYGNIELKLFRDPKTLLSSFMQFISMEVPDIITAWNSKFDIPYIVRKIYDYFDFDGLKMISPFKTVSSKVKKALYDGIDLDMDTLIPGIDVIDMLSLYKKNCETQKPSYSLKAITTEELGETKIVSENEEINDLVSMYNNDFITFCKYNIQDVRLMVLLENKVKFIDLALAIRNIVKTDYQDIFFETRTIDNMFVMEAVRRRNNGNWNYILPSKPKHINKTKFLGAYVKSPQTGLFKWIADLDFKSLYPSIVKTFKLSNETIVCDIDPKLTQLIVMYSLAKSLNINDLNYVANEILPKYLTPSKDIIEITENKSTLNKNKDISTFGEDLVLKPVYSILYHDMNHPNVFNGINEFSKWLKENNYVFMPSGVVIDQNRSDAIIADVIADIMTSREKYKKKMLQALADKKEDEAEVLDMNQRAVKVLNNSVYGVTANERFRLYDLRLAESITTAGQVIIRSSTYIMNEYANNLAGTTDRDYVITNDTDSIIFTLNGIIDSSILPTERAPKVLAGIANYSKLCQEHVNESIYNIIKNVFYKYKVTKTNNFLMIKNEWLANAGLFVAKKNYVINMVFKEGVPYEKMKSTGISLRRSSTPKVLKPFLENVLEKILSFADNNEVNQLIVEECRKIKEDYSIRDIALPISVNDMGSYMNLPVHIRGAKIWNDYYTSSDLNKITVGKVKYIYVKSWDKQELNLNKEYVISIPDTDRDWNYISDKIVIDYGRMRERLIIKPISIFYNALKWDIPTEIKTNNNGAFINMGTKISSKFKLI